jgi:hypothetical protein
MQRSLRLIVVFVAGLWIVAGGQLLRAHGRAEAHDLTRFGSPTIEITPAIRAAGLTFEPDVAPRDRAWILAAIAHARPEAQRLIGEVDGLVTIGTQAGDLGASPDGRAIGVTYARAHAFRIVLDTELLDGYAASSRDMVVLHELGHVIDGALIRKDIADQLDRTIPSSGPCVSESQTTGACTAPEERFADTFAKWALRGAVSAAGAGYGIDAPLLDEWALPLAGLAGPSASAS